MEVYGICIFSFFTCFITLICVYAIEKKEKIRIIAGFSLLSDDAIKQIDKITLNAFVLKMLLTVALLQFTTGFVCIFKITAAILIAKLIWLSLICIIGIILYEYTCKAKKEKKAKILKIHSLITIVFSLGSVTTLICLGK